MRTLAAPTPQADRQPAWLRAVVALLAAWTATLPPGIATAEAVDDDAPQPEAHCEPAAAPAAATTDDLYDLGPLAASDTEYAALIAAYRQRKWPVVARIAAELQDPGRKLQVRQAAGMLAALALQAQRRDSCNRERSVRARTLSRWTGGNPAAAPRAAAFCPAPW